MRWLNFLSRVAFICNLAFLLSAFLQYKNFIGNQSLLSTVVIIGYFLGVFIFSPLVNILYFIQLVKKRDLYQFVPKWLVVSNFIFLLTQIIFIIFFLNDTFYYKG